jgi:ferredoxin
MNTGIYYFTGTGNSLAVARDIANKLDGKLIPAVSVTKSDAIRTDAEIIGLVFPIYDFKAPELINQLIRKMEDLESKYVFAVCTYGVTPLNTMKRLEKVVNSSGGELSGGFTVHMPHSGLGYDGIPIDRQRKMFEDYRIKSTTIVNHVKAGKRGTVEKTGFMRRMVVAGLILRMSPKLIPMFKQGILKGWDSLGFHSDENCNGCGICEKVCPMENIEIKENKPVWRDNCLSCFACLHWCPQSSIQIADLTKKMDRYHHPDVNVSDIINQKMRGGFDDPNSG